MRKKIFITLMSLSLTILLVFTSLFGLLLFTKFENYSMQALQGVRVTLLETDGSVIFDNRYEVGLMENHMQRKEVQEALATGKGQSERHSDTTGESTYYYAVRLGQDQILRMSLATTSIHRLARSFIPIFLLVLLLSALTAIVLSRLLTRRIVAPLNRMDLENFAITEYEELNPLVHKIQRQKEEIEKQIAEIQESTTTTATITENMREGLILLDKNGLILLANAAAEYLFNDVDSEGKNIITLCRDPYFMDQVKKCLWGEKSEIEMQLKASTYQILFSPVYSEEDVTGAAIFLIDISDKKSFEKQRKEFAANVSHELKTPLTTILGYSEMIANGTAKDEKAALFAQKINRQSQRLQNIINDLISLAEFDEGKKNDQKIPTKIYKIAQSVLDQLAGKAKNRNVQLSLSGPQDLTLLANPAMIESMIYNLVDNGIKYNKDPGSVHIDLEDNPAYITIQITDTGIGIAPEHQDRIFERFYLVDQSRSKKSGGTGLGLSIVKHMAEYHGGSVQLHSQEGKGSTFTIQLKK